MGKPKFGYWEIRGLGQQIRHLLAFIGVDYEEIIYDHVNETKENPKSWQNQKNNLGMDAPNLPYWFDDKVKLTESLAIVKYVARTYAPKLVPSIPVEMAKAEQIEGLLTDIMNYFFTACYANTKEAIDTFNESAPKKLKYVSDILGGNKFLLGAEISYVDFVFYETLHMIKTYNPEYIKERKNLGCFMKRFEEIPQIDKYMKNPAYIKAPICGPSALNRM